MKNMGPNMTDEDRMKKRKKYLIIYLSVFVLASFIWSFYGNYVTQVQRNSVDKFLTFKFEAKDVQKLTAENRQVTYLDKNGIKVMVPKFFDIVIDMENGEILTNKSCPLMVNKDYKFVPINLNEKEIDTGKGVIFPSVESSKISFTKSSSCDAIFVKIN